MIKMLFDRILVKPQPRILSDVLIVNNTENMHQGTIIAKGPDANDVAVGQFIKYGEFKFPEWKGPDGTVYQILQVADVAAVVEGSI